MKKNSKTKKVKINYKLIIKAELIMIIFCATVISLQLYTYFPKVREAVAMATTKKPETFTELYFEDHLKLPEKIEYYKEEKFKFTIHNLENEDMNYPYEVYIECLDLECNGEKQIIDEASVFLKKDEYKTIEADYNITFPTKRVKVIVNLINKNQSIAFWTQDL